jgi:ribose/xylose/arabinose/galactoside ABC-type transport system permease subunit
MKSILKKNGAWIGFFALVVLLCILTNGDFLASRNLTNLMRQASINGILAGGMTLVILTGGIDLSIGSIVALCGILVGISQVHWGFAEMGFAGALLSAVLGIASGLFFGAISGGLIAWFRIAPFVITLGSMVIARGFAMIISDGASISPMGEGIGQLAGAYLPPLLGAAFVLVTLATLAIRTFKKSKSDRVSGVFPLITLTLIGISFVTYRGFPLLTVFLLFTLVGLHGILKYTTLGRSIFALGSNEKAAYWAGIPIKKTTVFVYTVMGALAGLAGVLLTSRLNGADPNAGQLFELDAIAAVVIGGTSLRGGVGSIMGCFIGALTIATLNNGMDLLGVPSFYQMVFKGFIIIIAVSFDSSQRKPIV